MTKKIIYVILLNIITIFTLSSCAYQNNNTGLPLNGESNINEKFTKENITPSEAILKSDRAYITEQIQDILEYYRSSGTDIKGRVGSIMESQFADTRIIPDEFDFHSLSFIDHGWSGIDIYDIQLILPLSDSYTLVMEAYLYEEENPVYWKETKWRIARVYFITNNLSNMNEYGWSAAFDKNSEGYYYAVTFQNTNGDIVRSECGALSNLPFSNFPYQLTYSPDGTKCVIEYGDRKACNLYVQDLSNRCNDISTRSYIYYPANYYGEYIKNSIEWIDENSFYAQNVNGRFIFTLDNAEITYVNQNSSSEKHEPPSDISEETHILLSENMEYDVWLYAIREGVTEDKYYGTEFLLVYGEKTLKFSGYGQLGINPSWSPIIKLSDLTGDGITDIIIIFTVFTGTGIHTETVHVFDGVSLEEYPVISAEDIIADSIILSEDSEKYYITLFDDVITLAKNMTNLPPEQLIMKYYYNYDIYDIGDNVLNIYIPLNIEKNREIIITYLFEKDIFSPISITLY